jgi:predicted phosphate transport protein (TIGR00153 family)
MSVFTSLNKLFGKSPFIPLIEHMESVKKSVGFVPELLDSFISDNKETIVSSIKKISEKEHEADIIKNHLRDNLPSSPFNGSINQDILNILHSQDSIADCAEDLAHLIEIKPMNVIKEMQKPLVSFYKEVMKTVDMVYDIVIKLDSLSKATFSGPLAKNLLKDINALCEQEHEADVAQIKVAKILFENEDKISATEIFIWSKILNKLGDIENNAEKTGNLIRLLLILK